MDRETAASHSHFASSPAEAVEHAFENDLMTTGVAPAAGPFVINLCASSTSLTSSALRIPGLEKHRVFQLSRMEEGRARYRVRVGIFETEAAAEAVLATVRDRYPTALVSSASAEDLRFIRSSASPTRAAAKSPPASPARVAAKAAPAAASKAAGPTAVQPVSISSTARSTAPEPAVAAKLSSDAPLAASAASFKKAIADLGLEDTAPRLPVLKTANAPTAGAAFAPHRNALADTGLSLEPERTPALALGAPVLAVSAAVPMNSSATGLIHVGARAEIPFLDLTLESDLGVAQPVVADPAASITTGMLPAAGRKLTAEDIWRIPDLDSTQTIRTLTSTELADENQPKWFVVQLAASDQPVNLDAMPQLDIFSAYRLYSVAIMEQGKILHALRLGFFKEDVSAQAVSGYVKTFFTTPQIVRVSNAEQERFAIAAESEAKPSTSKVIELNSRERPAAAGAKAASTPARTKSIATAVAAKGKSTTANLRAAGAARTQTLENKLRAAARDIEASQSGVRRLHTSTGSFLSRLVGKLSK